MVEIMNATVHGTGKMSLRPTVRRRLVRSSFYILFLLGVGLLVLLADWRAIQQNFFDLDVAKQQFPGVVLTATMNTIIYTVVSFGGGLILAFVIALMRLSPVTPYRWFATIYVDFIRGLPALLVIFGFAFALPIAFQWHPPGGSVGAGLLALIIVSSAYMAETIRAGIQAVPKGQVEAARSLGMGGSWTMVSIVLPQAVVIVIPPLANQLVMLLKDTSLLFIAGMALGSRELTTFARDGVTESANSTPLVIAGLMYLVIVLPLTQLIARLERRLRKAR